MASGERATEWRLLSLAFRSNCQSIGHTRRLVTDQNKQTERNTRGTRQMIEHVAPNRPLRRFYSIFDYVIYKYLSWHLIGVIHFEKCKVSAEGQQLYQTWL